LPSRLPYRHFAAWAREERGQCAQVGLFSYILVLQGRFWDSVGSHTMEMGTASRQSAVARTTLYYYTICLLIHMVGPRLGYGWRPITILRFGTGALHRALLLVFALHGKQSQGSNRDTTRLSPLHTDGSWIVVGCFGTRNITFCPCWQQSCPSHCQQEAVQACPCPALTLELMKSHSGSPGGLLESRACLSYCMTDLLHD
jgi:hypothetical protein